MNWTGREIEWKIPSGIEVNQLVASSLQAPLSEKCGSSIKLQAWEGVLGRSKVVLRECPRGSGENYIAA